MIRDAILHIMNEQPLLADLFEAPAPGDVGLRCTNLRMMNGKRPVFVDEMKSIFFFPYLHIRFVEIPPGAVAGTADAAMDLLTEAEAETDEAPRSQPPPPEVEADLEIDEDFLRRIREV